MKTGLNSLRMRAEREGQHLSGAERLIGLDELEVEAVAMLQRALEHPRGRAESIKIKVEPVAAESIQAGRLPDLYDNRVDSWQQGRELASEMLISIGVDARAITAALEAITNGAAPDGNSMRGAMLIDADSGERLEADKARGVRVSRMDLTAVSRNRLETLLDRKGLNNPYVIEALTLAAKVVAAPELVAELCWSDDPDYQAGYVASSAGYQRINLLKPKGESRGGRAFFIRTTQERLGALVHWLERQPIIIDRIGRIHYPRHWTG